MQNTGHLFEQTSFMTKCTRQQFLYLMIWCELWSRKLTECRRLRARLSTCYMCCFCGGQTTFRYMNDMWWSQPSIHNSNNNLYFTCDAVMPPSSRFINGETGIPSFFSMSPCKNSSSSSAQTQRLCTACDFERWPTSAHFKATWEDIQYTQNKLKCWGVCGICGVFCCTGSKLVLVSHIERKIPQIWPSNGIKTMHGNTSVWGVLRQLLACFSSFCYRSISAGLLKVSTCRKCPCTNNKQTMFNELEKWGAAWAI